MNIMSNYKVKKHLTDSEIEDVLNKNVKGSITGNIMLIIVLGIVGTLFSIGLSESAKAVPKLKILTVISDVFPYILGIGLFLFFVYRVVVSIINYNDVKKGRYFVTYDYIVDKFKDRYTTKYYAGRLRSSVESGIVFHDYRKTIEVSSEEVDCISYGEKFYMVFCEHSKKMLECYYSTERYNYIGDHEIASGQGKDNK